MWKFLFYIIISLNLQILIITDDTFQTLSNSGEKAVAVTSFSKDLYFLSSTYIYNIINQNFLPIKNNSNNDANSNPFYKNFEMIEASINRVTNESVFLIAENRVSNNKINLYNFNITSPLNDQNPKLIYSTNSIFSNSRVSLINAGIDKYLLSYIINETTYENIWFKYTYYEGFEILKNFVNNIANYKITTGISCFLLYDQFPICFYSIQDITNKFYLNIIVLDTVFIKDYLYNRPGHRIFQIGNNVNQIYFTKAIYLSGDHGVFCYKEDKLYCDIIKLDLNFETLAITLGSGLGTSKYDNSDCANDINKIDIIKIEEMEFVVGCIKNDNQIKIDIITVDSNYNSINTKSFTLNINAKTTLTLFLHEVTLEKNYYGVIFDDGNENKLKYAYLNLPYCSGKGGQNKVLNISFTAANNKFKLSDYLDIKIENDILNKYDASTYIQYKIISFSAKDDDNNIFNYEIKKTSDNSLKTVEDVISQNDELSINSLLNEGFHAGKFFIELAPINEYFRNPITGVPYITGRSCLFEFDTICYKGCGSCKKYNSSATATTNHNCISCKSSYYSMGDLCLEECSLIQGYQNVFMSKTCKVNELEVSNDCIYNIWSISQSEEKNSCRNSSYCPSDKPYVYSVSGECIETCRYSEFEKGECLISNITGGGEQALNIIHNEILRLGDDIFDYINLTNINRSIIMYGHNITIEITDTNRLQKDFNNNNIYISNILNISECEAQLREQYTISNRSELIILKIDLRRNDTASTQIEYQIYNAKTKALLDISQCKNIIFKSPLWLDDEYKKRVKELYEKNFDIFDINEQIYSDLCYPYYEVDFDADMTLEKRQRVFYYYNANLCEKSCTFVDLDINTYQAICDCPVKNEINLDITRQDLFEYIEEKDQKIVHEEKISNIKSMKCFKYTFSKDGFRGNWGSYFMMLMIVGFIIVGILWFMKGQDILLKKIRIILDYVLLKLGDKHDENFRKKFEELKNKYKDNELDEDPVIINNEEEQKEIENNNIEENNNIMQDDKNKEIKDEYIKKLDKNKNNEIEFIRKKGPKKNILLYRSVVINKDKEKEDIIINKKEKEEYLTDIEKDLLSYERAKKLDRRTYCGYYWSLLKLRQLIIFTFFVFDDFNLFLVKLFSFFLLLSFNLAYNAIFFFDKVINDIYDDRGKYSLKLQILNIFISSILFSFTIILIRFIIISHKKLIKLKNMDVYQDAQRESFSIHNRFIITYIIYYIIGAIFLIFFWYFLTSFGAIFHYTQNHCFLNAFISFCFSMIYPFIYCLIPALFRYLALKKNYERLYCISQYI